MPGIIGTMAAQRDNHLEVGRADQLLLSFPQYDRYSQSKERRAASRLPLRVSCLLFISTNADVTFFLQKLAYVFPPRLIPCAGVVERRHPASSAPAFSSFSNLVYILAIDCNGAQFQPRSTMAPYDKG